MNNLASDLLKKQSSQLSILNHTFVDVHINHGATWIDIFRGSNFP